jgi:hypothetical protein
MKWSLLITIVLYSAMAFGQACVASNTQSCTPNVQLALPFVNAPNWNVPLVQNFTLLDQLLSGNANLSALKFANGTISGNVAFTGNLTVSSLDNVVYVDGGKYPCSDVGFNAAIAALPTTGGGAGGGGGIVDARGCTGSLTFNAAVPFGTTTQSVKLLLGEVAITFANAAGDGFVLNCRGCTLEGSGPLTTNLLMGSGFTGSLIRAEPLSGTDAVEGIRISGIRLDGNSNAVDTKPMLNLLSTRNGSIVSNMQLRTYACTAVNVGLSTVASPAVSEGVLLEGIFIQAATPKTCDTVTIQGNRVAAASFNVASPSLEGTFKGIVYVGTSAGDGRENSLDNSSSISGYATALATSAASTSSVSNLNVHGTWFENFNTAVLLTGASLATGCQHCSFNGNFYLQGSGAGTPWIKVDFAQLNTIDENLSGGAGVVQLTANSQNNDIRIRSNSATMADITDAGTGNTIHATTVSGGVAQHDFAGQFGIFRNGTLAQQWLFGDNGSLQMAGKLLISPTAPTVSSGFGTSPSIVNSNGPEAFEVNVGTGGVATSGVLTMPTAANGWSCSATDMNTNIVTRETAFTTTSITLTAASAWTASDKLLMQCGAF